MLGGRDASSVATEHGCARRIDDAIDDRLETLPFNDEGEPAIRLCGTNVDGRVLSGVKSNTFEMQAIAERCLHHSALLPLARARPRTLQSINTIEQLWQPANHDLSAEIFAMVARRISRDRGIVVDISPDSGLPRDRDARTDRDMSSKTYLPRHFYVIPDHRRTGQTGQRRDHAMLSNAAVMSDLHQVVDFRTGADERAAGLRAIDAAVGADLDVVF